MNRHRRTADFRAARKSADLVVLEGFHAVKHALRFGAEIFQACTSDRSALFSLSSALAPDISKAIDDLVEQIAPGEFQELAPRQHDNQLIALARRPQVSIAQMTGNEGPIVLLERPCHLGNVGAVIRVAAAAEVAGVILVGDLDPWHPTIVRTAAGLHYAVPVLRSPLVPDFGRPIVAADPEGERIDRVTLPGHAVLAIGTEQAGLSAELLARSDQRVRLPMRSGVSSLNLAAATAAILYSGWIVGRS